MRNRLFCSPKRPNLSWCPPKFMFCGFHVLFSLDVEGQKHAARHFKILSGTFSKFRKAPNTFVMSGLSVCPSASHNSAPTGQIFMKIYVWELLFKSLEEIQVSLKPDKNNGYFTCAFTVVFSWILLRMINISNKICTENQNTFYIPQLLLRKSCHLWDNAEK